MSDEEAKKEVPVNNGAPLAEAPFPSFEEWVLGYRKPPIQHRFKKGVSGNPRGRPRKREIAWSKRQLNSFIIAESFREVEVTANGKKESISVIALAVRQMLANAARGNRFAFRELLLALQEALEQRAKSEPILYRVLEEREHAAILKGHDQSDAHVVAYINYWRKRSQQM